MAGTTKTLIGIDIGTTSVKAVLLAASGQRLAAFSRPYPTARPAPGLVEQDAADWLALVIAALESFQAHPGCGQVQAIGFTSQVNTHVFTDAAFAPLRPAIVWQDGRAAAAGAAIDAQIGLAEKTALLGAPIPVDASHALARISWLARHDPVALRRSAHVFAPKDFCIARLTGRVAADPVSSVGLVGTDLAYAGALIALVPGAARLLPPLLDPLSVVGPILPGLPLAGTPVVLGTMDAWASLFGVGVAEPGQAMYLSGTSEVLGLISPTRVPVPGVITFPQWAGITLHAGPTQAGGASLDWLGRVLGRGVTEMAAMAAMAAPVAATSPVFLPHLQGERAPLWDMQAKGAFAGLTGATGPAELVTAVMEGVAFSARLALEALEQAGAVRAPVIQAGGGGMAPDIWCQIRADVLGRPLLRMQALAAGAVGAADMAGVGAGLMPGLVQAAQHLVRQDRIFQPDPAAAARADLRFQLYGQLYHQLRGVNAALAG